MTENIPALIAEARERHRRTARHLPDPTSPTLVSRLADALESLSAPSGDDREVLMSDLIPDVLALVERIGNHVAAEYGEDPALDDMILQLRTSQPVQVEVTDDMVERGLKVSREFPRKRGLDNAYNVMRAVLEAALGGGE